MIAKLIIFVLKSSLFILNLSIFAAIGCMKKEKSAASNSSSTPSNPSNPSHFESNRHGISTHSTDKEPSKTPSTVTPDPKTPSKKPEIPLKKRSEPELALQKTQAFPSKESLKPPPRSKEVVKQQKTLRDVQEVDAKGVIQQETSANQDEFDDYLNKLGEKAGSS